MIRNLNQGVSERPPLEADSRKSQRGQSIIILAFAFMALLAFMGLALDLGLVYIERVRLRRAVDAATLAGVTELPNESQAFERAMEFIDANGYAIDEIDVYFTGCWPGFDGQNNTFNPPADTPYPFTPGAPYPLPEPPPRTRLILDTRSFQGDDPVPCNSSQTIYGVANKLSITGTVPVRMNFMQFFNFTFSYVTDNAIAQNVTNLDVAVVFDRSGSMEFDTICYNCWTPGGGSGSEYPNTGTFSPIPFDNSDGPNSVWNKGLCTVPPVSY
ncbi:MAG: TadE/TadG family type IV pilus assembly protein, partial [Anaerolineae bacterium]